MNQERTQEIFGHIFNCGETKEDVRNTFLLKESLRENCFVSDYIRNTMIPMSIGYKKDEMEYFKYILRIINKVIWERLFDEGKVYMHPEGEIMYLICNSEEKENLGYEYQKAESKSKLVKNILKNGTAKIVITDSLEFSTELEISEIFD